MVLCQLVTPGHNGCFPYLQLRWLLDADMPQNLSGRRPERVHCAEFNARTRVFGADAKVCVINLFARLKPLKVIKIKIGSVSSSNFVLFLQFQKFSPMLQMSKITREISVAAAVAGLSYGNTFLVANLVLFNTNGIPFSELRNGARIHAAFIEGIGLLKRHQRGHIDVETVLGVVHSSLEAMQVRAGLEKLNLVTPGHNGCVTWSLLVRTVSLTCRWCSTRAWRGRSPSPTSPC